MRRARGVSDIQSSGGCAMKHAITVRTGILCLAAAVSAAVPMACKKLAGGDSAVAVFVIGTVNVERPGELSRPVAHKDELRAGDTIMTGPQSLLVAQYGGETMIQVEANSRVRLLSLAREGSTHIELPDGGIMSRVSRLGKSASYRVQTRTSLAAVRGTEFRVTSGAAGSVVAVSRGTVAVARPAPEGGPARAGGSEEETTLEQGRAAEVNESITVRPVSGSEQEDFARFASVQPVRDLDAATEADLKKLQNEYYRGADDSGDEAPAGAGTTRRPGASDDTVAAKVKLWTNKQVYSSSEPVVVKYRDMPDYRNCWIDVSRASDPDGTYQSYNWTYAATSGTMNFSDLGLEPGVYEVRVHFGKSGAVSKRVRFRVQ